MCSSGVWISAIPFARLTHWSPRSLNTFASAAPPDSACQYYLYTSDKEAAARYREYGFDGAFLRKGEEAVLAAQVGAVFRSIRLRKLAQKLREERQR